MDIDYQYMDGNAALGAFASALGRDVSDAVLSCARCITSATFTEVCVYAPGRARPTRWSPEAAPP